MVQESVTLKVLKAKVDPLLRVAAHIVFWPLVASTAVLTAVSIDESHIPEEKVSSYPWTTEVGWSYCSRETYEASNLYFSIIGVQALFMSLYLFRQRRQKPIFLAYGLLALITPFIVMMLFGPELRMK
ncbi:MAG: hypothetical protein ACAH83_06320 [Alphaproteobacteria bacterium]